MSIFSIFDPKKLLTSNGDDAKQVSEIEEHIKIKHKEKTDKYEKQKTLLSDNLKEMDLNLSLLRAVEMNYNMNSKK